MTAYLSSLADNIEVNIVSLGRYDAMPILKQKLNGYRRIWKRVYIGVTSNPERRWAKHASNGWQKMVLLYDAYRPDIAVEMERELIEHAHDCRYIIDIENINLGGEGLSHEQRSNYLYVIVSN